MIEWWDITQRHRETETERDNRDTDRDYMEEYQAAKYVREAFLDLPVQPRC